jgi:hypothetical protein
LYIRRRKALSLSLSHFISYTRRETDGKVNIPSCYYRSHEKSQILKDENNDKIKKRRMKN